MKTGYICVWKVITEIYIYICVCVCVSILIY